MTRLRLLALLLSCLGLAHWTVGASAARADDPEPEVSDEETVDPQIEIMHHRWDRLVGVELNLGIENTPYGIVGAAVLIQPHRMFRIDVGGGGSRDGARVGGGIGILLPQDHFALNIRIGFAAGPLSWSSDRAPIITRYWNFAAFFNSEIGLEYRFDEGVLVRLYGGVETTLNDTADSCVAAGPDGQLTTMCAPGVSDHPARVFLGIAVGYMFDVVL